MSSLESRIKEKAMALGASRVGIARITEEELALDSDRLRRWLASGFAGEMHYLSSHPTRRADPRLSLEGARSVVVLAFDYAFPSRDEEDQRTRSKSGGGRIARYARGRDYHRILPKRMQKLLTYVQEMARGCRGRVYVDTGPVLERAWAARAGVGWVGKHSLMLRQHGGSWFLLGLLLLDCNLEPDAPVGEHCGSCTSCIDVCPTGAIIEPYVVDSRRCISYLTIELRGPIPIELRPLISDYIFGCDDCQDVCPWNRHAAEASLEDYRPRPGVLDTPLVDWLAIDEESFRHRFAGSPIARARRDGFLRNVCVALGNRKEGLAVPALRATLLGDPSTLVRGHAAWALGRIGGESASAGLAEAEMSEQSSEVLEEIHRARKGME